jgi:hypothetical protein
MLIRVAQVLVLIITVSAHAGADQPNSDRKLASVWLQRAAKERAWENAGSDRDLNGSGLVLDLIVAGHAKLGDTQGLREDLRIFERRAESQKEPMGRAIFSAGVAGLQWQLGEKESARKSADRARREADLVVDASVRQMVDAQLMNMYAGIDDFDAAERIAETKTDAAKRARSFCLLALAAHARDKKAAAAEYLRRAKAGIEGSPIDVADNIREDVGTAYTEIGGYAASQALAESISDPARSANLHWTMARYQHRAGTKTEYERGVARALHQAGRVAEADSRASNYVSIAIGQNDLRDAEGALKSLALARAVVEEIPDVQKKARKYMELADGQAGAGDIEGCMASIKLAREARAKIPAANRSVFDDDSYDLCDIARSLGIAGYPEPAKRLLDDIKDDDVRSMVWSAVVEGFVKIDRITDAQKNVTRVTEPMQLVRSCRLIGEAMAKARRTEELNAWVSKLKTPIERAAACLGAAEGFLGERMNGSGKLQLFQLGL